ncbi:hypothetical protein WL58_16720 [Burkholderia cepacia]|uniref:hypothetical protein n=1 Tax=Burkholderia cepacia TaxID=292 RepID=UPI00076CC5C8|nr:hypothetical protein [Burkholderia cepacia]KWC84161.1 hypothetical protein WL58_16720 [Burkholderia cepacia]
MRFSLPTEPEALASYLPEFMALVGRDRWIKRANQLADEMERSPHLHKIVLDYHWLEMNVCHQWEVFTQEKRVDLTALPELNLAALNFAATTVEVYKRLNEKGKQVLSGRVFDALKAENGFAALYLELSLAQRLLKWGFDIELPDMEGTGQFDLLISQGTFSAEVECKSQSVDAGRQIHRKHFYRLTDLVQRSSNPKHHGHREVVVVTLSGRLSANLAQQSLLADAVKGLVDSNSISEAKGNGFDLRKIRFEDVPGVNESLHDPIALKVVLNRAFGHNLHAATWGNSSNAYLLVIRSNKEDDPSFVTLEAMRKGASQLSKSRPSFLALQEHGIDSTELFLPHVQRRIQILSNALFHQYRARHVNAVYVTGYAAVANDRHTLRTPGFVAVNMLAKRRIPEENATALLSGLFQERTSVAPPST